MNQNRTPAKFNYGEALQKSNLFYLAQRSGDLPDNFIIPWRGDSALDDGSDVDRDLTGGYYDAGDYVKFGLPMAASLTMLSWGVDEYRNGYKKVGQLDETLANIKWGTDYILKAYENQGTATASDDIFWGQVGNGKIDHAYWGAAEDMTMARPSYRVDAQNPGSDLTGESAAALASASIVFRSTDEAYANKLLSQAQQLYQFAEQYKGVYSDSITDARNFYNSWSGYQDELAWGAMWLHQAIEASGKSESKYLDKAENYYQGINPGWTQNWDDKSYGTAILLAQETNNKRYKQDVEAWLDNWASLNGSIKKTDGGLAWLDRWGSLRYAANTAFLAGIYSDTVTDRDAMYSDFAESQIDYMLGDNPRNFSYMVGFGDDFPQNPHHRGASGTNNIDDSQLNEYILYGALVGGPSAPNDNAYEDKRTNYITNEVALDYNAAFTGAIARMTGKYGGEALTEIPGINLTGNPTDTDPGDEILNPGGNPVPTNPGDDILNPVQDVNFSLANEWKDGFEGSIEITNNSNRTITSWKLEIETPFEIEQVWQGRIENHQEDKYIIKDVGWNSFIAPDESIEFGFIGKNIDGINGQDIVDQFQFDLDVSFSSEIISSM